MSKFNSRNDDKPPRDERSRRVAAYLSNSSQPGERQTILLNVPS